VGRVVDVFRQPILLQQVRDPLNALSPEVQPSSDLSHRRRLACHHLEHQPSGQRPAAAIASPARLKWASSLITGMMSEVRTSPA
jgi:hypothetical protein